MSENSVSPLSIPTALAELAATATSLVAPYLRSVARSAPEVGLKQDIHDPVTVHDQRTEAIIRWFLAKSAPGSTVLGEEMGEELDPELVGDISEYVQAPAVALSEQVIEVIAPLSNRVRWIVDPIDGTANFASGLTYFGTSIGVELDGEVVAGAISVPFNYEIFVADDRHFWHEDERDGARKLLTSRGPTTETEALLATYYPGVHDLNANPDLSLVHEKTLMNAYSTVRRPGAGAVDLAMVAAGWIGVSMATALKPWDVAAGIHMVRVAGGSVLNLPMGTDLPDGLRPGVVASVSTLQATTAERVLRELDAEADASLAEAGNPLED